MIRKDPIKKEVWEHFVKNNIVIIPAKLPYQHLLLKKKKEKKNLK
jgi:hypothetical protein